VTKKELLRLTALENALCTIGFTSDEAAALRRISNTLQRWYELECGNDSGAIERDEATGKPYWINYNSRYLQANDRRSRSLVADREAGALRRLQKIMRDVNERRFVGDAASTLDAHCDDLNTYIQTDPRGAALYILRPGDIPAGYRADSCYINGICVY
jgi:hypothetical protein